MLHVVGALETLDFLTLSLGLRLERLSLVLLIRCGVVGIFSLDVLLALELLKELFVSYENAVWVNYSNAIETRSDKLTHG